MNPAVEPDDSDDRQEAGSPQGNAGLTALDASLASERAAERAAERVRYLFRQVGNNAPARALEQQLIAYRLGMKSG